MTAASRPDRTDPRLLLEMQNALRAEIGARAIYHRLARQTNDRELAEVLGRFHVEECEQVERLCHLIRELGGRARAVNRRRSLAAALLAFSARAGTLRMCLRLCHESEMTVERWYQACARFLVHVDRRAAALVCEELALTKCRHARILEAWIGH